MIYTSVVLTVGDYECKCDKNIVLYRGDKNIEIQFKIEKNRFVVSDAAYASLIIKRPSTTSIFSEPAPVENNTVIFTITEDMIDELNELGGYTFQIRLFDKNMISKVTLPPCVDNLIINRPIAVEGEASINEAMINDSAVLAIASDISGEEIFTEDNKYNKTIWLDGDIITDARMNKIENALWTNTNDILGLEENYATKDELEEAIKVYATETYVDNAIRDASGEQVAIVINEAIANGEIVASALTATAISLLISILQNATFTTDQSANINALENELNKMINDDGSEVISYNITNNLSNCNNNNSSTTVEENSSYEATITPLDGYELESVTCTMGGVEQTVTDGAINITQVTGDIVITASAAIIESSDPVTYNLSDLATTILDSTKGSEAIYYDCGNPDAGGYGKNTNYTCYIVENVKAGDVIETPTESGASSTNQRGAVLYINNNASSYCEGTCTTSGMDNYSWKKLTFTFSQDYEKIYVTKYATDANAIAFAPTLTR